MVIEQFIYDTHWVLDNRRVAFLPEHAMLIISDLHFGKANHFRKEGIAIPLGVSTKNMNKLSVILKEYQPERVLFLGDLFHSSINQQWVSFVELLNTFKQIQFLLVEGNHDILDQQIYQEAAIKLVGKQYVINKLVFVHEPGTVKSTEVIEICGHIHPKIKLTGNGRQVVKLPCFYFKKQQAIMPAFGEFTGGFEIKPKKGEQVYPLTSKLIFDPN